MFCLESLGFLELFFRFLVKFGKRGSLCYWLIDLVIVIRREVVKEYSLFLKKITGWMMFGLVLVFASACNESEVTSPRAAEEKPTGGMIEEVFEEPQAQERNCDCEVLRADAVNAFLQNEISVGDRELLQEVCFDITEECINKIDEVLLGYCLVAEPQAYFRLVDELIEAQFDISMSGE